MTAENTHLAQKIDSFETLAFLADTVGVAQIRIRVINDAIVEVDTLGRSRKSFDSLRDDVVTRLIEVGYKVSDLTIAL